MKYLDEHEAVDSLLSKFNHKLSLWQSCVFDRWFYLVFSISCRALIPLCLRHFDAVSICHPTAFSFYGSWLQKWPVSLFETWFYFKIYFILKCNCTIPLLFPHSSCLHVPPFLACSQIHGLLFFVIFIHVHKCINNTLSWVHLVLLVYAWLQSLLGIV